MGLLDKIRGIADGMRGVSIPTQEFVAIDGVSDTGQLLRAVDAAMPRGATLVVAGPRSPAVEEFVRRRAAAGSDEATGHYQLPIEGTTVTELAVLADQMAPAAPCAKLLVTEGERHLVEAFRRDAGEDVVWVCKDLPADTIRRFRETAEGHAGNGTPNGAPRGEPHRGPHGTLRTAE